MHGGVEEPHALVRLGVKHWGSWLSILGFRWVHVGVSLDSRGFLGLLVEFLLDPRESGRVPGGILEFTVGDLGFRASGSFFFFAS